MKFTIVARINRNTLNDIGEKIKKDYFELSNKRASKPLDDCIIPVINDIIKITKEILPECNTFEVDSFGHNIINHMRYYRWDLGVVIIENKLQLILFNPKNETSIKNRNESSCYTVKQFKDNLTNYSNNLIK